MRSYLIQMWVAAAAVCAGTGLGSELGPRWPSIVAIAIGVPLLSLRRHHRWALLGLALVVGGVALLNSQLRFAPRGPLAEIARGVPRCSLSGTVIEDIGGLGALAAVDSARCGDRSGTSLGVISVAESISDPGARFDADGWLVPLDDGGFDRSRNRLGAQASFHPAEIDIVAAPRHAHAAAARVRAGLRTATAEIEPARGALLRGLTIGDTSAMGPSTIDMFRASGLSHVLAVSGSNVAIVLGAVLTLFGSIGLRSRVVVGAGALSMFVLIVGPDASVLRAGVMGAIALACLAHGRTAEPLAALAAAISVVVLLRPGMLFSVGMHLSVAATAGIVLLAEPIAARLVILPRPVGLLIAASSAAQIAVTPILILVFEELSIVSPVANALALPAVAPATVIGLGAGVMTLWSPPLGTLLVRCIEPALAWVLGVAYRLGDPAWASIAVGRAWGWVALFGVGLLSRRAIRRWGNAE